MRTKTTTLKNGTKVTKLVAANSNTPEWKLQAAQVRRLRSMPEYGRSFLLVGGMEAGRRGPQAATIAKATGLTAGHPDITIFLPASRCGFIENKTEEAAKKKKRTNGLDPAQVDRHAALLRIGHVVEVIVAANENEAADKAEAFVRRLLAANDNRPTTPPITEGYVVKGGRNVWPSQIARRPPPPPPVPTTVQKGGFPR